MVTITKEETLAAFHIVTVAAEIIREAKEIPSGHLYVMFNARGVSYESYQAVIACLKRTKLVEEKYHLLKWVGPDIKES